MTTPIPQPFKVEPGLNAPKINKRQIVRSVDVKFGEIKEKPKTITGYGITDAVVKTFFDEKIGEIMRKIKELEQKNEELEARIIILESSDL